MSMLVCRWGLMGTATIGRKAWKAIGRTENGAVVAVASRDLRRAEQYIDGCQSHFLMPSKVRAAGNYEALLDDDEVDAVYIPLPTGVRKEWVIRAARAGKHVLCEKPCAASADDLREMLKACDDHGVQFMDGVMFMHSSRLAAMRAVLDDPQQLGVIRRIASQFSFCADAEFLRRNIRVQRELEPFGCLGDLGWYNIRWALWVMKGALPIHVQGTIWQGTEPRGSQANVPLDFSAELEFENGVTSSFYCSFVTHHQQWAHVSGTLGSFRVDDFVLPFYGNASRFQTDRADFNPTGWDFNMEHYQQMHEVAEFSNSHFNAPETRMFRHFNHCVLERRLDPLWPDWSLKTQIVLDACLLSAH